MNKKQKNLENIAKKATQKLKFEPKSEDNFVWRGIILLIFVFGLILLYSYNAYQNYQKRLIEQEMQKVAEQIIDSENIEAEIYDLSDEDLSDENLESQKKTEKLDREDQEIKDIAQLSSKINEFEQKIAKFEERLAESVQQKQINAIILAYFDFRKKLFQGDDFSIELQNLEVLVRNNEEISQKIAELKPLLPEFKSDWQIKKQFKELQPLLLARQNNDPDQGFVSNLRYNLSKMFVVRNLHEDGKSDIEKSINKISQLLKNSSYQVALNELENLDSRYNKILEELKFLVENRSKIKAIDEGLLKILNRLS